MTAGELLPQAEHAFVGLGSNLDEPRAQIDHAVTALDKLPHTRLLHKSALYQSPPMGPQDQPAFINAVVELETRLLSHVLLEHLQAIEAAQGRVRGRHWGPRTLDLDLLVFGGERISSPRLVVPHPGLHQRPFVLYPLAELAPALEIPGKGTAADLAARLANDGTKRLAG